jgi:hypothetical protein
VELLFTKKIKSAIKTAQMILTHNDQIEIELQPDPVTLFSRKLIDPDIRISTRHKIIEITWHMEHRTPTGSLHYTTAHQQIADNELFVVLETQAFMTLQDYEAAPEPKPVVMGEYYYWQQANKNSPFPVMEQVAQLGVLFAQKKGWL